jgi:hypothetical protein
MRVIVEGDTVYIVGQRAPAREEMGSNEQAITIPRKVIGDAFRKYYVAFVQRPGETWRQVVARVGTVQGLKDEVLQLFDELMLLGDTTEDNAAFMALYDWDCIE